MSNDYKLALGKIEQLTGDLWGCSFNESTTLTANASIYRAPEPLEDQIKSAVLASDVAHFDENGGVVQHYERIIQYLISTSLKHSMSGFCHLVDSLVRKDVVFQAGQVFTFNSKNTSHNECY